MGEVIQIDKFLKKPEKDERDARLERINESVRRINFLMAELSKLDAKNKKDK